ncbi:hypothetical protein D3C76_1683400 [compost metagenome]
MTGLVIIAGVVVNRLSAGAQSIEPREQVTFAALAMVLQPLRFGGGLAQVLLYLDKAHVLTPKAFGIPFFKGLLPLALLGQTAPFGLE